jgi:hypothetical protein
MGRRRCVSSSPVFSSAPWQRTDYVLLIPEHDLPFLCREHPIAHASVSPSFAVSSANSFKAIGRDCDGIPAHISESAHPPSGYISKPLLIVLSGVWERALIRSFEKMIIDSIRWVISASVSFLIFRKLPLVRSNSKPQRQRVTGHIQTHPDTCV